LCAGCPDNVIITVPDLIPYRAGDVLTCSSDGYPAPTYEWKVDAGQGSTASTQALREGRHVYECKATVTFDNGAKCDDFASLTVTAYSKCQKQHNTILTTRHCL